MPTTPYRGVFPVVPTIFDASGALDLAGQRRVLDFMIDAGSQGLCILANYLRTVRALRRGARHAHDAMLGHVAGRVPVIVTTTHFSLAICAERSRRAQEEGAAMVMVMPPYHGATIRVGEPGDLRFLPRGVGCDRHSDHDPGRTGRAARRCPAAFLARMAREIAQRRLFQDRNARAPRPSCAS